MKSREFESIIQNIRDDFYMGHIQADEALETIDAVMRDYGMLAADEKLVELPENFRSRDGMIGPFRVKHDSSPYVWSRSYGLGFVKKDIDSQMRSGAALISDWHTGSVVNAEPTVPIKPMDDNEKAFFNNLEQQMEGFKL